MKTIQCNTGTRAKRAFLPLAALFLVCASLLLSCKDLADDDGEDNKGPTTYTVTFNLNDDTRTVDAPKVQTIIAGQTASIPETVEDTKKSPTETVVSWYTEKETTNKFDFNTPITRDITLYAKWSSDFVRVIFNLNYDEANPTSFEYAVEKSATTTAPPEPTREGYVFEGWYTEKEATNKFDLDNTSITADIMLYAKWLNTYTVKFNTNGGSGTVPDAVVSDGRMVAKPSVEPTREGYVFEGWYTEKEATNKFDFDSTPITAEITLYANWKWFISQKSIGMQIPTKSDLKNLSNIPESLQIALEPLADDTAARDYDVVYFTPSGAGAKDGTSWATAYSVAELKKAIDDAGTAAKETKPYLVVLDQGTYSISTTLSMKNNVAIIGSSGQSILDGGGNTRVFSNDGIDKSAVLYGVTITNGMVSRTLPSPYGSGGGMYNTRSSPSLIQVTFSSNKALSGGGMYNIDSSPILTQVTFSSNAGSAMYNSDSSPILTQVTFSSNTEGAMYNSGSSPILTQVTFSGNTAVNDSGGGMYNINSSPILTQVTFSENTAGSGGGGMYNTNSSPILTQVTFSGNTSGSGGGAIGNYGTSATTITNSIFWGNKVGANKNQIYMSGGSLKISNSIVEGATDAERFILKTGFTGTVTKFGITNTDPTLTDTILELFPGASVSIPTISTSSSAVNEGLYVQREGSTLYYSTDASTWYTSFSSTGLSTSATLPADAIDLTAKDITDYTRINRPDIGAYEFR